MSFVVEEVATDVTADVVGGGVAEAAAGEAAEGEAAAGEATEEEAAEESGSGTSRDEGTVSLLPGGASTGLSISASGGSRFAQRLDRIAENLDLLPAKAAPGVFASLEAYHRSRWGDGVVDTASTDERWPGHAPLVNTGRLRRSLTQPHAEGSVRRVGPDTLEFGTSVRGDDDALYPALLQHGTRRMSPKRVLRGDPAAWALAREAVRRAMLHGSGL